MFDTIIVGIDGHAGGRDALALGRELAAPDATIAMANVYLDDSFPTRGSNPAFTAERDAESRELLAAARSQAGLEAEVSSVAAPSVGRGLHELAEDLGADLLVVGSSHHGLLGRVVQGDHMRSALNGAPCAVAVAPRGYAEHPHALTEIGVGYDGSPEARTALDAARRLAARHGARVSVFEALAIGLAFADAGHPGQMDIGEEVDRAHDRLDELGGVEAHAAYGDPAEELALFGASVDLLIVGSRGYGPLGRLVHGSTSWRLAGLVRCPLLVLPRSAARLESEGPRTAQATAASSSAGSIE